MNKFELYESVRIKSAGITGVIVSFDDEDNPSLCFVEKHDKYKTGDFNTDLVWVRFDEIERI